MKLAKRSSGDSSSRAGVLMLARGLCVGFVPWLEAHQGGTSERRKQWVVAKRSSAS